MKTVILFLLTLFICINAICQNVGIGTSNPVSRLHVADSNVLFTGPASLPATPGLPPISGAGTRMMWYPNKAAFRVGHVITPSHWNEASVGRYSFAAGLNTRAAGQYSFAFGNSTAATGDGASAWGSSSTASGNYAVAMGYNISAPAYASTVVGRYNEIAGTSNQWVETDPLFVVGNGYVLVENGVGTVVRQNAFQVNKNGNAVLNGAIDIKENSRIRGNNVVDGLLDVKGSTLLRGNATVNGQLGVDTINSIKRINANYTSGTTPSLNIVPIGVARISVKYDRGVVFDDCIGTYTNLAGNIITSKSTTCADPTGLASYVRGLFYINQSIANQYTEIVAAPCLEFKNVDGNATAAAVSESLIQVTSKIAWTDGQCYLWVQFTSANIPGTGVYGIEGTVIFYGLN